MGYRDHGSDFGHTSLMKDIVQVLSRELEKKISWTLFQCLSPHFAIPQNTSFNLLLNQISVPLLFPRYHIQLVTKPGQFYLVYMSEINMGEMARKPKRSEGSILLRSVVWAMS